MKPKAVIKMSVDIAMTVLLLFQMGYHLWGEQAHEWSGAAVFLLFVLHHILNRGWYRGLFRGRHTPAQVLQLVIDLLVIAAMAAQAYSGIILSRHVFRFLPIRRGMALARRLHILGAYWGYLFIGLHLGLHWGMVLGLFRKRIPDAGKKSAPLLFPAGLAIAAYGSFVLLKRDLADNLFLRTEFVFLDYEEPWLFYYLDYLALMGLCVFLAYGLGKLLRGRKRKGEEKPL